MFAKVDYTLENIKPEAVWENVIIPESQWAVPKAASFKSCLRKVHKDHGTYKALAKKLKKHLEDELSRENQYTRFVDALGVDTASDEDDPIEVYG